MTSIEFAVSVLEAKYNEKKGTIKWLADKIRRDQDNSQWRKMAKNYVLEVASLKLSIKILKNDWKYRKE
jgi:hypothetical protein